MTRVFTILAAIAGIEAVALLAYGAYDIVQARRG